MPKCSVCGKRAYSEYCVQHKPRKPIRSYRRPKSVSARELDYQEWKESVARPYLISHYENRCACCDFFFGTVKLDIDHIKNKGSHPELKRDLGNLQLLCRQCHARKTDRVACPHA